MFAHACVEFAFVTCRMLPVTLSGAYEGRVDTYKHSIFYICSMAVSYSACDVIGKIDVYRLPVASNFLLSGIDNRM